MTRTTVKWLLLSIVFGSVYFRVMDVDGLSRVRVFVGWMFAGWAGIAVYKASAQRFDDASR